jgi:MoxR-like ATPase
LVRASRLHASVELGASPRATLGLYRAAQGLAAVKGRGYVLPDDVKRLAPAVLTHRLIVSAQSRLRGRGAADVLTEVIGSVPVPVEDAPSPPALSQR